MIIIDGVISEVGVGEWGDGVLIDLEDAQRDSKRAVTITGFSRDELRAAARMLYHRVTIRVESRTDRARFNDEQPAPKPISNIDDETGIPKSGEI